MRAVVVLALLATACCTSSSSSSPPPSSALPALPPMPPPSSPEQPILSPGACRGDDLTALPLVTSTFASTLPLEPARARLDEWNEWCPDTACEGSFNWYAYDLRGDATHSEVTMRTYSLQRGAVPDVTGTTASGAHFQAHVVAQHVVPQCIVPCLPGVYSEVASPCLALDVRFALDMPVPVAPIPITSPWDETLTQAGIALERALRAQVPEDFGQ